MIDHVLVALMALSLIVWVGGAISRWPQRPSAAVCCSSGGGVSVQLLLRGRTQAGIATAIIDDPGAMTPAFIAFLRTNRQAGGFQAVPLLPDGEPEREAVTRVLPTKVMVQIALA